MSARYLLFAVLQGVAIAQSPCEFSDLSVDAVWTDGSRFGHAVALQGDRLAVSKMQGTYQVGGSEPGSVYMYRREGSAWLPDGVLQGSDVESGDDFGYSVAMEGDRVLVGAIAHGDFGAKGAVYAFERQGDGVWLETQKLVPDEPHAFAIGWSIAIDGDAAVIGAKGANSLGLGWGRAYVYELDGGVWQLQQELLPSFSAVGDSFGISVDIEGDRIVVGASYFFTFVPPSHGWAFVFDRVDGVWSETAAIVGDDTIDPHAFGHSVAVCGDTIAVGDPLHDSPWANSGAVYVFEYSTGIWTQVARILDSAGTQYLGWFVDMEPGRILAGAWSDWGQGDDFGAAYLLEELGGTWQETAKFWGSKLVPDSTFGSAVDLDEDQLVVGAAGLTAPHPGAAYLFSLTPGAHLTTDANELSLSAGDQQTLHLGGCPDNAGDLYALAGTASGSRPGFSFGGLPVPLNPDAYFLHTVNHPAGPPLSGAVGFLDAFGCAEATFGFAPGTDPSLAGTVLHHAWARLDPATLALEAVSPAAQVALVP